MAVSAQPATVIRTRHLSPAVRELVLLPQEQRVSFKPGQWVSLQLPIGDRPPLVRAYTMADPEADSGELVLVFDRVPHGRGSDYLSSLEKGDQVPVAGPYGTFTLPEPLPDHLVFMARYTGIVPVRCMIRQLSRLSEPPRITLLYTAPSKAELIYHHEFLALASRSSTVTYLPGTGSGEVWGTAVGDAESAESHHQIEALQSVVGDERDFFPMVCGLKAFVRPIRAYLSERGFQRRQARYETYD